MRVALAGNGLLVTNLLREILASSHEVVALIQNGRNEKGLKRSVMPLVMGTFFSEVDHRGMARRHGIPLLYIDKMNEDELAPLRELSPDLILVGGFSIILKKPILELPSIGCVNTHSSLLPMHRGPNPFSAVIMDRETETGVTFHKIDEGIDTGEILQQHRMPIEPRDNAIGIHRKTARLAAEHVVALLDRIESEGLQGTPQDPNEGSYDKKMTEKQAWVRWDKPAEFIDRLVRANYPHNIARFKHKGKVVYIRHTDFDPEPVEEEPGTVLDARPRAVVATARGKITLSAAFRTVPIPWIWPNPFTAIKPGDRLE